MATYNTKDSLAIIEQDWNLKQYIMTFISN